MIGVSEGREAALEEPTREDIAEVVELRREELSAAIENLKTAVRTPVDLRELVAARPWSWVAGAFVVGLWMAIRR